MESVKDVQKAFDEAIRAGRQKLRNGEITWDEYAFVMLGFEDKLRSMGVDL